jgi:hypothetical protein
VRQERLTHIGGAKVRSPGSAGACRLASLVAPKRPDLIHKWDFKLLLLASTLAWGAAAAARRAGMQIAQKMVERSACTCRQRAQNRRAQPNVPELSMWSAGGPARAWRASRPGMAAALGKGAAVTLE